MEATMQIPTKSLSALILVLLAAARRLLRADDIRAYGATPGSRPAS